MVQNRNKIVSALSKADMELMQAATCEGSEAKREKNFPVSMKNGAPGGCPTSSL